MVRSSFAGATFVRKPSKPENQRMMHELISLHRAGLESAIQAITDRTDVRVVYEGSRAYTDGSTIVLPNVEVFGTHDHLSDEDVENARAYFMALRGFAWREAARLVETDIPALDRFQREHGSFARALQMQLDEIRIEHRFASRGQGLAESMEYMRERWVWPRVIRRKQTKGPNLLHEIMVGLQIMLKHYEAREEHVVWKALEPESRSFVERNVEHVDRAYDTIKMGRVQGTERMCEIVTYMLECWGKEFEMVLPLCTRRAPDPVRDTTDSVTNEADLDQSMTQQKVPPLLLITVGPHVLTLATVPFGDTFVRRVEWCPNDKDEWVKLVPLAHDEARTIVVHPPDPEIELKLNRALAKALSMMGEAQQALEDEAKRALEEAQEQIKRMPADQRPYLVWTTRNDRFVRSIEGTGEDLHDMRETVSMYYEVIKSRLEILLTSKTKRRWKHNRDEGTHLEPSAMAQIATSSHFPNRTLKPFCVRTDRVDLLDTLVGILTDTSGSMEMTQSTFRLGGRLAYESRLTLARYANLCFAECLHKANIPFGSFAFSSREYVWQHEYDSASETERQLYGRFGGLSIETLKDFDQSWTNVAHCLPRLGRYSEANYDADSVEWLAQQMLARRARRRVMFVLSDGRPATGEPDLQVARQQRHLGDVVKAIMAKGIEVIGIGICDDSVAQFYPHHVIIKNAADLPKVVLGRMEQLLLKGGR
jgi:cobalamin biosynthesis protein CobT